MATPNYRYSARTAEGGVVHGFMQAPDVAAVVDLLRARGLFVTAVDPASDLTDRVMRMLRIGTVSRTALLGFFRSFATLIRAGVSIGRGLNVAIERTTDARLAEALRSVLADVEQGTALSFAMGRRPHDFPPLYVAMIRAGEAGGILDDVLDRLAFFLEREAALRKKVQSALAYPAVVISAACVLVVFMIAKIMPMFAQIFASFQVELPLTTQLLIDAGNALAAPLPWLAFFTLGPLAAFALYRFAQTTAGAMSFDRIRLALPIVGPLLNKAICARVARMLATLLRSGVELVGAIDAVVPVAGSAQYARAFAGVNAALRDGEPLARSLTAAGLFDPMFLALVRVGEETGLLDEMLFKIAEYFESDVEAAIATLGAVLEPALILVLGCVVGFIVCSIFIPLYSLIGSISK
jgi:type IV pilus assembly protein PilC